MLLQIYAPTKFHVLASFSAITLSGNAAVESQRMVTASLKKLRYPVRRKERCLLLPFILPDAGRWVRSTSRFDCRPHRVRKFFWCDYSASSLRVVSIPAFLEHTDFRSALLRGVVIGGGGLALLDCFVRSLQVAAGQRQKIVFGTMGPTLL